MTNWLPAALLALLSFGAWGLFTKLTVLHIDAKSALIYQALGVAIVGIIMFSSINFKPVTNHKGLIYALLTGAAYAIGCWFYFIAASKGKIITVVTLTALYPLVTILLAFLVLREVVNLKQACGIALAFVAILLMSS
ncbi:MAG: EamA family transporter [Gammaproteobacteria bacterium]